MFSHCIVFKINERMGEQKYPGVNWITIGDIYYIIDNAYRKIVSQKLHYQGAVFVWFLIQLV